jgi:(R,R)-butanediol dehydrogenase/meso-butanediol dehydrogenase/diacetyl reductase
MKAAVFQAVGRPLVIEDVRDPVPGDDEVVVQVGRCGICGSDLHMTEDPVFAIRPGNVLGHEFAGEVVELGSAVKSLKVGDRVSVSPLRGCGKCPTCKAGHPAWCPNGKLGGGGYAQYALAYDRDCVRLPADVSLEDGALVEPLSVALHGVAMSGLTTGANVLVVGAGPIGLGTAYWARRFGARRVIVTDLNDFQEERALAMGATGFLVSGDDIVQRTNAEIGSPPDVVFECVGKPGVLAQCIEHVRIKGTVVVLGLCTAPDTFVPFRAVSKEVRIQTSAFFDFPEFCRVIDTLESGDATPHALITGTVRLAEMPGAFEALRRRTTECKVLVDPRGR